MCTTISCSPILLTLHYQAGLVRARMHVCVSCYVSASGGGREMRQLSG